MSSVLGHCECGGTIFPVWCRDGKQIVLSHGCCMDCFCNIVVEQMTRDEYSKMARRIR